MEEQKLKQDAIRIGANIRRLRQEKHMGQTELVRLLQLEGVGMTRECLVKIERGAQHIQATRLRAIRDALGLSAPSPLRWRQTLVYAPLLLFLCAVLPVLCRFIDRAAGADVPVFSALVLPFLLLPAGGFCAGLSLGRRAGFCPLFAPAALALYLPAVYLVFNPSALFQAFILFFAALLGTLLGAALRRLGRGKDDGRP